MLLAPYTENKRIIERRCIHIYQRRNKPLLQKRIGELPQPVRSRIQALSLNQLEELGEALLDFTAFEQLLNWLEAIQPE